MCSSLGHDHPMVISHTLGGMVAVEAAASHPDIFGAAVPGMHRWSTNDPALRSGIELEIELFRGPSGLRKGPGFCT